MSLYQILMPRLSDSMTEGTISAWLVSEGNRVQRGQTIAEIETDKAIMPYETDREGLVVRLLLAEGDSAELGEPIAELEVEAETSGDAAASVSGGEAAEELARAEAIAADHEAAALDPKPQRAESWVSASPLARAQAREQGIDLANVTGSGPSGRVVAGDLPREPAASSDQAAPKREVAEVPARDTTRIERLVARRMSEAKQAPEFWAQRSARLDALIELRAQLKAQDAAAPSLNDLIMFAAARAAAHHPRINSSWQDEQLVFYPEVHLGMAVATDDGLVVPTIRQADRLSLSELSGEARRLAQAVRDQTVTAGELEGATFTVSNLGAMGIEAFQAILVPGQSAILAVGGLRTETAWEGDQPQPVQTLALTLTVDHRSVYGAHAAAYLADLAGMLENPLRLL